ncbi:MAG TPA: carboxypeptidase regulatory-like domain-containing protein [Terriglobales bacterium]|nr:carboxypeptidase regulatory-like domain-containing protein [Terriglobales bacterium]
MKMHTPVLLAVVLLLLATLSFAQAVATGDLHITVKDQAGNLVTNATVTAREEAKGLERSTNQNSTGEYRLVALPPGVYVITVQAPGFAKVEAENQIVTVGQVRDLAITLSVAGAREVVTVSSEAELVETSRTSTTDTVDQRRIDNLPINGRNYINFTLTDSQVLRDNAPSIGAAPTSGLNISGQRARSNLVNVDGADAIDNSINGVRSTVSQEAVQEFQIQTNSYAAEYGRASGGVVNIVTRSGSNDFHGTVFGYLRNRDFQAVNPFSTTSNPAYTRVQAGAAFGGPIKKDKTYYYFSYEVTRRHETGFSSVGQNNFGLIPNLDLSSVFGLPDGFITGVSATPDQAVFFQQTLPAALAQLNIIDPTGQLAAGYAQEAAAYATFVGGSSGIAQFGTYPASFAFLEGSAIPIPANGSNPLTQFPTSCNVGAPNFTCNGLPSQFLGLQPQAGNYPIFEGTSLYSLRLDHNLSNNNRIMLRGNVSPSTVTGIQVNGENQTFGQNSFSRTSQQTYRDVAGVFQDTWTIGNNKVNEFRFQYARRGLLYDFSSAPGGGLVASNIAGFGFVGREPYSYIKRTEQRYQFSDNFSWTRGAHDLKFGVDLNYIPVTATFTVNYGGVYDFGALDSATVGFTDMVCEPNGVPSEFCPPFPGFNAVQSFGLGLPSTLVQGFGNPHDSFRNIPLGLYIQDSWRFRHNLTINAGLRYDVEFPPQFAPPTGLAASAYNQLGIQKGIQTDTNNIQPRIGIAWDPRGDGKSVFRASYGIFYDHPLLGLYFLGDASDGSKSGQLVFAGGAPCDGNAPASFGDLNAANLFQGTLGTAGCLPGIQDITGYGLTSADGTTNPQRFDPFFPNSVFLNQNYLNPATFFPLAFQPFGYPQGKNFVYAYSQQVNFTFEQDLGHDFALSLAYNFNGGRHLNRPINANTTRGDFLVRNWQRAIAAGGASPTDNPLSVAACGVGASGPYVPAALVNFFRPSGLNPAIALALLNSGDPAQAACVQIVAPLVLQEDGFNTRCDLTSPMLEGCVPFSDMDANFSNGSSVYHGFTANLRKRFGNHYEFLTSYTWSHAIDDSTDLQSPLAPQDSFFPSAERSNSLFDQRHRLVFSGVFQSGKLGGSGFARKFFSNWTVAPILEVSSGRPFNILTGNPDNFQFSPFTGRPNVVTASTAAPLPCPAPVASRFSPTGFLQEPCYAVFALGGTPTLAALDGNLGRNAGVRPWTVFNDLRIARRIPIGERFNVDAIVDMFNIANRFNVADINPLFTAAGQPTAAYDPRQFQFALKVTW